MSLRRFAIAVLGVLGVGVLLLTGYLAWQAGVSFEAGGWIAAGYMAEREIVSKIENIALGLRQNGVADDEGILP